MKKLIIAFGFLMMLASCNQTKIAYVDVEEVIKEYQGSKDAEEVMKAKTTELTTQLEPMAREFQAKVQEYQQSIPKLSSTDRAKKEQELMQEQQMIQQRQQMAQQQVQQEGLKMIESVESDIQDHIAEYAKKNGYSFVLGTSNQTKSVIYGDETLDITEQIIEDLNSNFATSDKADEVKEEIVKDTLNNK
ncbi:MAG: OmpH family outer membrane protein [Bacteroidota bacterium]